MRSSLATVLVLAAGGASSLAIHAQAPTCSGPVCIEIDWKTPAPERVTFDGGDRFEKREGYFIAPAMRGEVAEVHDIAVNYPGFAVPLRLISSPDRDQNIHFLIERPKEASCERDAVNEVARASSSGTIDERVALLMRARRLIGLCSGAALSLEQPKLVRRYFDVSCSLAGDNKTFFAIHRDARERFEALPQTRQTTKTLKDCKGRGVNQEVGKVYYAAQRAQQAGDSAKVKALTDDLLAKAAKPEWKDGFAAAQVTPTMVRAIAIRDLKAQQNAAAREDVAKAIELNQTLQDLQADPKYEGAFTGVTPELLQRERSDLEARLSDVQADSLVGSSTAGP